MEKIQKFVALKQMETILLHNVRFLYGAYTERLQNQF